MNWRQFLGFLFALFSTNALVYFLSRKNLLQLSNALSQLTHKLENEQKKRLTAEKNREQDRAGRISAEKVFFSSPHQKALATLQQSSHLPNLTSSDAIPLEPIGYLRSCFRERHGTPRQGLMAPNSHGILVFTPSTNPTSSLDHLSDFSHVWLLFIFHHNTNVARKAKFAARGDDNSRKTPLSAVKSKVRPPRLGGKKVGLFSTRTPHRPNPLGLSLAKVDRIDSQGRLYLSSIGNSLLILIEDLVDGTPILDIKPYVPQYDSLASATAPDWVTHTPSSFEKVEWNSSALENLEQLKNDLEFYSTMEEAKAAIEEVLLLDIRSVHQRKESQKHPQDIHYNFFFDQLKVVFTSNESTVNVVDVQLETKGKEKA